MRFTQSWFSNSVLAVSLVLSNISWAKPDLDARVAVLENIVSNELNMNLLSQIDTLQQDLRELRGTIEEQQNLIQLLQQKQEKLFLNLESRLDNLKVDQHTISTNNDQSEKALYDNAYSLLRNNKYESSILAFQNLVSQYPDTVYASNAYYWLGELYLVQWQQDRSKVDLLTQSKDAFNTVIDKYHGQEREGHALLKLALIEMDLDHIAIAKEMLEEIVGKYPNSAMARVAANNLQKIEHNNN